jgi:hypothetical protein
MEWTAIATFVLAFIATASIVVTVIIRAKDIGENRRIREEDRELNFKSRLLDEVRDWAREAVKLGFLYKRIKSKAEISQVNDMIEEIAKTSDVTSMVSEIFANELEVPVRKVLGFVKNYKDPREFASKEYFDSLFELLKAVNKAKRKLLKLEKESPTVI